MFEWGRRQVVSEREWRGGRGFRVHGSPVQGLGGEIIGIERFDKLTAGLFEDIVACAEFNRGVRVQNIGNRKGSKHG